MKVIFLWELGFLPDCKACLQVRFNLILWVLKTHSRDSGQKSDKIIMLFIDSVGTSKDFFFLIQSLMIFFSDFDVSYFSY